MHSSISSSDRRGGQSAGRQVFACLLTAIAVLTIGLELATDRIALGASNTQRRIGKALDEARGLRPNASKPGVLLVGNSLLVAGVIEDTLRAHTRDDLVVRELAIEQTTFFDWYYGVRHLFSSGARPDVVAVMLPRTHLLNNGFRGPYSVFRMVSTSDLPALARDLRLHPTVSSSYYLAAWSSFYGMRAELRGIALRAILPGMESLAPVFGGFGPRAGPKPAPAVDTLAIARERLRRMKQLVEGNGAALVWVLPPAGVPDPAFDAGLDRVLQAAREEQVAVLPLDESGTYGPESFSDGFHLNHDGAARFTMALGRALRAAVPSLLHRPIPARTAK